MVHLWKENILKLFYKNRLFYLPFQVLKKRYFLKKYLKLYYQIKERNSYLKYFEFLLIKNNIKLDM